MKEYNENELLQILKDEPIKFFEVSYRTNLKEKLESLQNIPNIDYFELAFKALNENGRVWNISNILKELVPYSKYEIQNIIKLLIELYEKKDHAAHFQITQSLALSNYEVAKELLEKFSHDFSQPFIIPHIAAILSVLHNKYNESQYKTVISFLDSDDNIINLKIAISNIRYFNFSNRELKEILELFKEKVKLSNEEIDRALLYSSCDLIEKGYEYFSEILLLYMNHSDINIKGYMAQVLFYTRESYLNKKWFKKSFLSIIDVDIEHQNIIHNIEFVLEEFLKNDDYSYIKEFLFKWLEKGNLSSISSKSTLSTFSGEFNEHKLFNRFVTESLVYENNQLHQILPHLIEKDIQLDVEIMESFSYEDYLYVCRKILGYFHEFSIMNTMIFSILSVNNLSKRVKDLVTSILVNYIGKDYSHNTLEFFKNLDDFSLNKNEKEVKDKVVNVLEKYNEQIKALPILKELTPPSQQNRLISRTNRITMGKAMKESEKDSFWSQIATKIPICCGRGWFGEFNGDLTDVSYMQSHSHSITMPVSSRTHPVHYELERFNMRVDTKGDK